MHLSEDDIRTKVVYEWLKNSGFSTDNISVEYSLDLHFGKTTKTFHPRADVLVKSDSGLNLIIVEVKSKKHKLDDIDINQAISYSRSLKGGIAPFTILTNGTVSRLFDSVTKDEIKSDSIPANHKYVLNGFLPTSEGIEAKLEAAEYLISLSIENLKTFCKTQIEDRMSILKGIDILSGKKYIPSLYVERQKPQANLRKKLFINNEKLVLIVGNPQKGKTCFICHTIETFVEENNICLFYPAISLRDGLLSAIKDDFSWCFGENLSITQLIRKVERLCKKNNQKIYIFIDGWDEMAVSALELNEECKRLSSDFISIVISLTIPSLNRLLIDEGDNLTSIGNDSGLSKKKIEFLGRKRLKETENLNIIQIDGYTDIESKVAKSIYFNAFNIKTTLRNKIFQEPFYLRIICELYFSKEVPKNLVRTEIIHHYLLKKVKRKGIGTIQLTSTLSKLGKLFYKHGRPIDLNQIIKVFGNDQELLPWKESGILVYSNNQSLPMIDFYNSNILNYTISVYYKKWNSLLGARKVNLKKELENIFKNIIRKEAFLWFLSCPENSCYIQQIFNTINLKSSTDLPLKHFLTEVIIKQITLNDITNFGWLEDKLTESYIINNGSTEIIPALIFAVLKSIDVKENYEEYKYWIKTLLKYDNSHIELGFDDSYFSTYYGEIKSWDGYDGSELDTHLFYNLIFDEDTKVAEKAALYYSYCCVMSYLENFRRIRKKLYVEGKNYSQILFLANNQLEYDLGDMYYGYGMCKGWLLHSEKCSDEVKREYYKMNRFLPYIIKSDPNTDFSRGLRKILEDLRRIGCVEDKEIEVFFEDPNQIKLDL